MHLGVNVYTARLGGIAPGRLLSILEKLKHPTPKPYGTASRPGHQHAEPLCDYRSRPSKSWAHGPARLPADRQPPPGLVSREQTTLCLARGRQTGSTVTITNETYNSSSTGCDGELRVQRFAPRHQPAPDELHGQRHGMHHRLISGSVRDKRAGSWAFVPHGPSVAVTSPRTCLTSECRNVDRTWQYPNRVCVAHGPAVAFRPVRRRAG
jgi:hypothetical protein